MITNKGVPAWLAALDLRHDTSKPMKSNVSDDTTVVVVARLCVDPTEGWVLVLKPTQNLAGQHGESLVVYNHATKRYTTWAWTSTRFGPDYLREHRVFEGDTDFKASRFNVSKRQCLVITEHVLQQGWLQ